MQVKLVLDTFYLNGGLHPVLENHLNKCQLFGRFGFLKSNPNRILVFRTSLAMTATGCRPGTACSARSVSAS